MRKYRFDFICKFQSSPAIVTSIKDRPEPSDLSFEEVLSRKTKPDATKFFSQIFDIVRQLPDPLASLLVIRKVSFLALDGTVFGNSAPSACLQLEIFAFQTVVANVFNDQVILVVKKRHF